MYQKNTEMPKGSPSRTKSPRNTSVLMFCGNFRHHHSCWPRPKFQHDRPPRTSRVVRSPRALKRTRKLCRTPQKWYPTCPCLCRQMACTAVTTTPCNLVTRLALDTPVQSTNRLKRPHCRRGRIGRSGVRAAHSPLSHFLHLLFCGLAAGVVRDHVLLVRCVWACQKLTLATGRYQQVGHNCVAMCAAQGWACRTSVTR